MNGAIDIEPERYIAEKPYELTRFEYSILKKSFSTSTWFNLVAGATSGLLIAIIGKVISSLFDKQPPTLLDKQTSTLELWEIIGVIIGFVISFYFKKIHKSEEDIEKEQLMKVVNSHFDNNKPRRLHLTNGGKK